MTAIVFPIMVTVPFVSGPNSILTAGSGVGGEPRGTGPLAGGGLHPQKLRTTADKEKSGPQGGTTGGPTVPAEQREMSVLTRTGVSRLQPAAAGLRPRAAHPSAPGLRTKNAAECMSATTGQAKRVRRQGQKPCAEIGLLSETDGFGS